jgi:hypothetical protein
MSTVLYAVQLQLAPPWPQGFDAAMSRTHSAQAGAGRIGRRRPFVENLFDAEAVESRSCRGRASIRLALMRANGTSRRWTTSDAGGQRGRATAMVAFLVQMRSSSARPPALQRAGPRRPAVPT